MRSAARYASRVVWIGIGLLLGSRAALAGGPLSVSADGRPFTWEPGRPIRYTLDQGNLGRFSNTEAARWVSEAFQRWIGAAAEPSGGSEGTLPGVALAVQATAPAAVDITGQNIFSILFGRNQGESLIVLDSDGTVFDTFFGLGAGSLFEGIGLARDVDQGSARITQGLVILNGRRSREYTPERMQALIQHELGHFMGLAHTQLNRGVKLDGDPTNDALAPCMSYNAGPNGGPSLHAEDRAWIAALYRRPAATPATGTIRGRVLLPDGTTGFQGIQVIARREGDERVTAVSGVSGYLYKVSSGGGGSRDISLRGYYELPGLLPGNYRLSVEPLDASPAVPPTHGFLPGGKRFWREEGPLVSAAVEASVLSVSAGQGLDGRDFILDGPAPPLREVAEREPNDSPAGAQAIPLPTAINGRVGPRDATYPDLPFPLPGGETDRIADWYRVLLRETTTLSALLTPAHGAADLNLYLLADLFSGDTFLPFLPLARSTERGAAPEAFQVRLPAGVYYIGVSSRGAAATDYRLVVTAMPTPTPPRTAPDPPRITWAVTAGLAHDRLQVRWQTDQEANSVLYVGHPLREVGSPMPEREHRIELTGLEPSRLYELQLFSRNAAEEHGALPPLFVWTGSGEGGGGAPELAAELWIAAPEDAAGEAVLAVVRITNRGRGSAYGTRIDRLVLPAGWACAEAPPLPLDLGEIGAGATGLLAVRLARTGGPTEPVDLRLEGSYAAGDGARSPFAREGAP
jgi:hypothetical protein